MASKAERRATPRRSHPRGAYKALVKPNDMTIAQLERDRERRENFDRGCRWAALLLCGMFAFLSVGCAVFGW